MNFYFYSIFVSFKVHLKITISLLGRIYTSPNFRPMSIVAKRSPISATAEILFSSHILCNKRLGSRGWARCNLQNNNKHLASLRHLPHTKIKTT